MTDPDRPPRPDGPTVPAWPAPDPLGARAQATPDATALLDAASGRRWDVATLRERALGALAALRARGLGAGDHVGVLAETRPAFATLVHAAAAGDLVLVPLNARQTAAELAPQLDRADVSVLVCTAETEAVAKSAVADVRGGVDLPVVSVDDPHRDGVASFDPPETPGGDPTAADRPADRSLDHTRCVLFTSGTTGRPKPVRLTDRNLLASATASAFRLGVTPGDRWLVPLSMYHMGGLAPVLRSALYGTAVVLQRTAGGFDPDATLATIDDHDVTGVSLVPTMLERVLDAAERSDCGADAVAAAGESAGDDTGAADEPIPDLATLRFVLLGGAPAPTALIDRCERLSVPVHPTYGMTETASQVATARPAVAFDHRGTVGQPLLWTDVTVVDPSALDAAAPEDPPDPLPAGEAGELVVAGPAVTPGYYDDPEATDRAFCAYGLRTGDVGYRDDAGRLWVTNRLDDRIVTGGETVDPGEVAAVLRSHPDVDDAAVVGLDDPEWGQRIAALVVPATAAAPDRAALRAHCRERLAGYKHPRTIGVVDELPRTPSGTVDRAGVRERLDAIRSD